MKVVSALESQHLYIVKRGRQSLINAKLQELQLGETLLLTTADIVSKAKLNQIVSYISKASAKKFENGILAEGTWAVRRVQ